MQCGMRLVIVVLAVLVVSVVPEGVPPVFTDQFVVQVEGGPEVAKDLAKKHGFTYHAQVSDFFSSFHSYLYDRTELPPLHSAKSRSADYFRAHNVPSNSEVNTMP